MEEAIKRVDSIIAGRGECVIGSVMAQLLRCDKETLVDELKARGYVVDRAASVKDGYVVYPRRKRRNEPWMVIQVI